VLDGIKKYEEYWGYLDTFDEGRKAEREAKPTVTTKGRLTQPRKRKAAQVQLAAARRPRAN
jgi:hypothetical protein